MWVNKGEQNLGTESSALSDDRIYSVEGLSKWRRMSVVNESVLVQFEFKEKKHLHLRRLHGFGDLWRPRPLLQGCCGKDNM